MQYLLSPFAHHLCEYAAKLLSVNKKPAEAGFRVHLNATPEGVGDESGKCARVALGYQGLTGTSLISRLNH